MHLIIMMFIISSSACSSLATQQQKPITILGNSDIYETIPTHNGNPVDYTYPRNSIIPPTDSSSNIYELDSTSPIRPSSRQLTVPHSTTNMVASNYLTPNKHCPADYTYAGPIPNSGSLSKDHASNFPGEYEVESHTLDFDEDQLYHSVGPSIKQQIIGGESNQSFPPPPAEPPNLPPRRFTGQKGFHQILDGALKKSLEDVSVLYEDPTKPMLGVC